MDGEISLLDFGINDKGEYVNLKEEEEIAKQLSVEEVKDYVRNHDNPLARVIWLTFFPYHFLKRDGRDVIKEIEQIIASKTYHFANMSKNMYIFSLSNKNKFIFAFENNDHYLVDNTQHYKVDHDVIDLTVEDYITSKEQICFPATCVPCFDKQGNVILDYYDGEQYQKDIRHICCMKEWEMGKYSTNRIEKGKKIKDFYEVQFYWRDMVNYIGEKDQ